jgi:hypothetical protein
MNNLIQSLPSPSPTAGITHTWMGESLMVDGEASVMKISSKSRPGRVTERSFWFWIAVSDGGSAAELYEGIRSIENKNFPTEANKKAKI